MSENQSLKERSSETAGFVTYFRACSHKEKRISFRGPDYLAKEFHVGSARFKLRLSRLLLPILKRVIPGTYEWVVARTFFFDEQFKRALERNFDQIVILGAGFDSRAYRFSEQINRTVVYEVDTEATQNQKKEVLAEIKTPLPKTLRFVPVDFNEEDLSKLFECGFVGNKKNLFIWEGVTEYLTEDAVDKTLEFIKQNSASGSEIAFTYVYKEILEGDYHYYGSEEIVKMVSKYGEPYTFGIAEGKIAEFLSSRGLRLIVNYAPKELEQKYLTDEKGKLFGRISEHQCVVLAEVV
jgi:methyltransferase (TIGR00027 family)